MLSCGTELNLLKDVDPDKTNAETSVKMVKFAKHELHESTTIDVAEFKFDDDNHKVTLVSKISPTETMIYTNGGYSFKYNEKDNTLEKLVVADSEPPDNADGQECPTDEFLSCKCQRATKDKRYVTAKDEYMTWITKEWITREGSQPNNPPEHWALIHCSETTGSTTASTGHANVPPQDFEKDKNKKAIEPLLLYLNPKNDDAKAEALIYSNRQLFIWSNHINAGPDKDIRGSRLVKKNEGDNSKNPPKELLPGAEAREKQGMLGGMTSTAEGITVWLKNNKGAIVYVFQGNKEHTNKDNEKVTVPQFNLSRALEIDVQYKDKAVDKFAIWLPSDKTKADTEEGLPKEITGKIVAVSNKHKKLLVAEAKKGEIIDKEEKE